MSSFLDTIMQFLAEYPIFVTLIVALIVMGGILFYLIWMESRLRKVESELNRRETAEGA